MAAQSFKNHTRWDPKIHFVFVPLSLLCFVASILHVIHQPTPPNVLLVPVTFLLLLTGPIIRSYSIKVQDRLIRLEESLRLKGLGVSPEGLTVRQFVGLRFASDAELPALAIRAKAEGLSSKQIKEAIVNWRADEERV